MPHWRTMMEKDHLGAWDLVDDTGKRREYTLKIAKVESKLLKTREQPKGKRRVVITFERARKKFVANTTNCETLESLYGGDVAGWVGKSVTLYATEVRNPKGGADILGIRVKSKAPTTAPEAIPDREVDPETRKAQNEAFDRGENADEY